MFAVGGDEILGAEIASSLETLEGQYSDLELCVERINALLSNTHNNKRLSFHTMQRLKFSKATHQIRAKRLNKLIKNKELKGAESTGSSECFVKLESHVDRGVRFSVTNRGDPYDNSTGGDLGTWCCVRCKQINADAATRCKGCANFAPFQRSSATAKEYPAAKDTNPTCIWKCCLCQTTNVKSVNTCKSCNGWVCNTCKLTNSGVDRQCKDCREKKPSTGAIPLRRFGSTPRERLDSSGSLGVAGEKADLAAAKGQDQGSMNILSWFSLNSIPTQNLLDILENNHIDSPSQLLNEVGVVVSLGSRLKVVQQKRLKNALLSLRPGVAALKLSLESKEERSPSDANCVRIPVVKNMDTRSAMDGRPGDKSSSVCWTCALCHQGIHDDYETCRKCQFARSSINFSEAKNSNQDDRKRSCKVSREGSSSSAEAFRQIQLKRGNAGHTVVPHKVPDRLCVTPPLQIGSGAGVTPPFHRVGSAHASSGGGLTGRPVKPSPQVQRRSASPHPTAYKRQQESFATTAHTTTASRAHTSLASSTSFAPPTR